MKFKPGDKVICTDRCIIAANKIPMHCTITEVARFEDADWVRILELDNDHHHSGMYLARRFELTRNVADFED